MILKTILAAIGFGVMPNLRNDAVHNNLSIRSAAVSGHRLAVRLSDKADRAYSRGDREAVKRVSDEQSKLMQDLDDLTRRLDR